MRIRLFFCLSILAGLTINAAERSENEMVAIAQTKLTKMLAVTRNGVFERVSKIQEGEHYGIYGSQNGFVVVSKDKDQLPVLGFSSTPFEESKIPCGLQWWLNTVDAVINQSSQIVTTRSDGDVVEPLLTTTWGQGEPFNLLCPTLEGQRTPSGCMATAMAQIVNYFKYPETGKGVSSYSVLGGFRPWTVAFGETYHYELLKDNYDENTLSGLSDDERNAISTLLLHCGAAVKMNYNADGSGATLFEATNGFASYFRYDSLALRCYERDYFTNEEWLQIVKKELSDRHPLLYCGYDSRAGGHAFVIDGIDSEGLVHVNWGWDGDCNGYYSIDGLTPKRTIGYSAGYNFSSGQEMLSGYKLHEKPDADDIYNSMWISKNPYKLALSGANFVIKDIGGFYNKNWLPFEGAIALVFEEDKDNGHQYGIIIDDEKYENYKCVYNWGSSSDELGPFSFVRVNNEGIPAGNYKVFLGTKDVKETRFQPFRCGSHGGKIYFSVTKGSDGTYTIDATRKAFDSTTGIQAISENYQVGKNNDKTIYDLQGRSYGDDPSALPKGVYIINGKKVVK